MTKPTKPTKLTDPEFKLPNYKSTSKSTSDYKLPTPPKSMLPIVIVSVLTITVWGAALSYLLLSLLAWHLTGELQW